MTDYSELKRLAGAAKEFSCTWHSAEEMRNIFSWEEADFIAAAEPAACLALIEENEALRKDLEAHKRMLLQAAIDIGSIGEALGAEMDDDVSEMIGIATELRANGGGK